MQKKHSFALHDMKLDTDQFILIAINKQYNNRITRLKVTRYDMNVDS